MLHALQRQSSNGHTIEMVSTVACDDCGVGVKRRSSRHFDTIKSRLNPGETEKLDVGPGSTITTCRNWWWELTDSKKLTHSKKDFFDPNQR
jgi:hypothetical protein